MLAMAGSRARTLQRSIAANVRRLAAPLTQEQLAEKAGIDSRYVQDVERGKTNRTVGVLVGLAVALGVDERDLLAPATMLPPQAGRPPRARSARRA
jgi:transcriptional regulator with XRE-family HTH domain